MRKFLVSLASIGAVLALTASPALADMGGNGTGKKQDDRREGRRDLRPERVRRQRRRLRHPPRGGRRDRARRQARRPRPAHRLRAVRSGVLGPDRGGHRGGRLQRGGGPRPAGGEAGAQVPRRSRPPSREAGRKSEANPDAAAGLGPDQGPGLGRADRRDRSDDHDRLTERLKASNGIIHVVDGVLLPYEL